MDGSGRNFLSLNRFFSAQEIVGSNLDNGSADQTNDGRISHYGQHVRNNQNNGRPGTELNHFEPSSIFGDSRNHHGQFDGHNNPNIGDSIRFQPQSNNEAIFGGPNNQFGQFAFRTSQIIGTPNAFHRRQLSLNNSIILGDPGNQYGQRDQHNVNGPTNTFQPFQSDNSSVFGVPGNGYGQRNGGNCSNIGGTSFDQFQPSSRNSAVFGVPGNQYGHFDSRYNHNIGGPMPSFDQFQPSSGSSAVTGVPGNQYGQHYSRYNDDFGGSVNGFRQSRPNIFGTFGHDDCFNDVGGDVVSSRYTPSNHRGMDRETNRFTQNKECNNNYDKIIYSSGNETQAVGPTNSSHINANADNQRLTDASTKIEHAKLKAKIIEAYKEKAPKQFAENSARFDEEEWLKVWYTLSNGLRLYQTQMVCPICYKKVTPQNRSEPGNLPRWELTIVKGHLDRIHTPKIPKANPANNGTQNEKKNEENGQKPAEEKTENEMEGKQDKKNAVDKDKEDGHKTIENPVAKKTTEPLEVSSPESVRSVRVFSESSSEDEPESSSSSDEVSATKNGKRRIYTRKQSCKRAKPSPKKEIPDWRLPGVQFRWVKFSTSSNFVPAFIFPLEKGKRKQKARQLLSTGEGKLAEKKGDVYHIATETEVERAKKLKQTAPYLAALKQFNVYNKTNFR